MKIKYIPENFSVGKDEDDTYEDKANRGFVDESQIDRNVLRLVKALNCMGFLTCQCCEGSYRTCIWKKKRDYNRCDLSPWVNWLVHQNRDGRERTALLKKLLSEYNKRSAVKWAVFSMGRAWSVDGYYEARSLTVARNPKRKLRKSEIDNLAFFIYDKLD